MNVVNFHQSAPLGSLQAPGNQLTPNGQFPAGIGEGQNQLINNLTFPAGIGNGQNQLINNPTFPAGIGNGQIQLINTPTFPAGIGNGQIQLINQVQPGSPYLGLNLGDVADALRKQLKVPADAGVYVKSVLPNSPAEKAGIKAGDVVLECARQPVNALDQMNRALSLKHVGDAVKILVNRGGKKRSFHVKLEAAPSNLMAAAATRAPAWMGADIQDIDAVIESQFNLPDRKGVVVSHVAPDSPAAKAGIRGGDVIRRLSGTRIRDVKQFQKLILDSQPGDQAQLTLFRNGQYETLPVVLGQMAANPARTPMLGQADITIEGTWIGMDVSELSQGDIGASGLPAGTQGIVVNDVESPPASMVGFQTGDVIVAVNSVPTPDMKQFETATRKQSGAVVEIIRGTKHIFMSVPPPGFTRQGTKIDTGVGNTMRQVAAVQPAAGRLGIITAGPDLNSAVTGCLSASVYLILVDFAQNAYAVGGPIQPGDLPEAISQNRVAALVCTQISPQTATGLSAIGVNIYSGVVGSGNDAIGLYSTGALVAMKGF